MQKVTFQELIDRVVAADPRYRREAYLFIREALGHAQTKFAGGRPESERHVTGQQILAGIREYATSEYGPMILALFHEWGIRRCEDFGEIVFNLIDHEFLRKSETDRREDFAGGYDFQEAFGDPYLPPSVREAKRRAAPASPGPV